MRDCGGIQFLREQANALFELQFSVLCGKLLQRLLHELDPNHLVRTAVRGQPRQVVRLAWRAER